uniref:PRKR interacting protein 1 n=1 Tax=Buteo japonicus TaxID=224669 RepID=A0A8C0BIR8_9AVES
MLFRGSVRREGPALTSFLPGSVRGERSSPSPPFLLLPSEKTVPIPEKLNEWAPRPPPEFVRDVMGSSAGAGSGEFHVYRHLRRREYQRQDFMDAMAEKQRLDEEFQKKLERNKMIAEEQTAKRRRKRYKTDALKKQSEHCNAAIQEFKFHRVCPPYLSEIAEYHGSALSEGLTLSSLSLTSLRMGVLHLVAESCC